MFSARATLPTLLGVLIFLLGLFAFFRAPSGDAPTPVETVQTAPIIQVERSVALVNAATGETRTVNIRTPDAPSATLEATLAALRTWLVETSLWPEALGVPTVFRLDEQGDNQGVVLDFPLETSPDALNLSVQQEQQLLISVERTVAQQGVSQVYILTNGRSRPVFLEYLAVEGGLE